MARKIAKCILVLVIFLLPLSLAAQQNRTISGIVTDAQTGERLYSATVFCQQPGKGSITNRFGFFSISLPEGKITLKASFVGYNAQTITFRLQSDTTVNFSLKSDNKLDEVVVKANNGGTFENNDLGHIKLSAAKLAKLPSLMGEKDVLKTLTLLPGVQQGNEGSAGIFVRGGSPDQNLILLDDVPLYNVSHLLGFVSVFTPEAINSIDFYKGGFPARYGGRLSSVVDLRMKDGNKLKNETSLTFGVISSQLVSEGPIRKNESSYFFSVRRTLLDLLFRGMTAISQAGADEKISPSYGFYDLNAKLNFKLNDKNQLYWSFYSGRDKLRSKYSYYQKSSYQNQEELQKFKGSIHWGNMMTAIKLNTTLTPRFFLNTTLSGSIYNYGDAFDGSTSETSDGEETASSFNVEYQSQVRSVGLKTDLDIYGNSGSPFQAGIFLQGNDYLPGRQKQGTNGRVDASSSGRVSNVEAGAYLYRNFQVTPKLQINAGIRSVMYAIRNQKTYFETEPRLNINFNTTQNSSVQLSYARMTQPVHLLSNGSVGLPTDVWVPSTKKVEPETSDIFTLGLKKSFTPDLKFSTEVYFKKLDHVISFTEGDGILDIGQDWEQKVTEGTGRCYGLENELRYSHKKLEVWIAYTLSRNERKFEDINRGRWFPYQYDRRHKIDLGFVCSLRSGWTSSVTWTYQSGAPATYTGLYYDAVAGNLDYRISDFFTGRTMDNSQIQYYTKINGVRLPAYHRLDIGFTREWEMFDRKNALSISVYNVYSRQNPFLVFTKTQSDGTTKLRQFSLFPIIPAVSYRVSF